MRPANRIGSIFIIFFVFGALTHSYAKESNLNVCEQVSDEQLAAICPNKLFPTVQAGGCQWSIEPGDSAYFQIGVIESQKNLRDFFKKEVQKKFELKRISDLGDRGLMTVSEGHLAIIVIREGDWVLVSTADLLYIKIGSERQKIIWDIYKEILRKLR